MVGLTDGLANNGDKLDEIVEGEVLGAIVGATDWGKGSLTVGILSTRPQREQ